MNELFSGLAETSSLCMHPVYFQAKDIKQNYLYALSAMVKIDGNITPQEIFKFRQIAKDINYPDLGGIEKDYLLTSNIDFSKTEAAFKLLCEKAVTYPIIIDMLNIALADMDFHSKEEKFLSKVAKFLGIEEEIVFLFKELLVEGCREKSLCSEDYYKKRFEELGLDFENYRFWFRQVSTCDDGTSVDEPEFAPESNSTFANFASSSDMAGVEICVDLKTEKKSALIDRLNSTLAKMTGFIEKLPQSIIAKLPLTKSEILGKIALQQEKVFELRLHVAFVGAMNSGKSTAINAIVGEDVLPSRSETMTVVPTNITHSPIHKSPLMRFTKARLFNDCATSLADKLSEKILGECEDETFYQTLKCIYDNQYLPMPESCEGVDNVREKLEKLHHLARAFIYLNLANNPVDELKSPMDFPEVLIEFAHAEQFIGRFTEKLSLVDTPGPNEVENSENLRAIVKRTLEKADAIVCVVDPNQLDGDSQDKISDWIINTIANNNAQFFAFLNKSDLISPREKKDYLEKTNLEKKISRIFPERVFQESGYFFTLKNRCFPISSKFGILAHQAQKKINSVNSIEQLLDEEWFDDFFEFAFGATKKPEELELSELENACSIFLKRSNILLPLEKVFHYCLARTFPEVTNQTKNILLGLNEMVSNCLELELHFLECGIGNIVSVKGIIEGKLATLTDLLKTFEERNSDILERIKDVMNKTLSDCENELKSSLAEIVMSRKKEFSFDVDQVIFYDKGLAKSFVDKIYFQSKKSFENLIKKRLAIVNEQIKIITGEISEKVKSDFLPHLKELEDVLQKELCFQLSIPSFEPYDLKLDFELAGCANYKVVSESTIIRERSWWTLNLLADDKRVSREYFVFDLDDIIEKLYKKLGERFITVSDGLNGFLKIETEKVLEFCKLAQEKTKTSLLSLEIAIKKFNSDRTISESSKQVISGCLKELIEVDRENELLISGIPECKMFISEQGNRTLLVDGKELEASHKLRELFTNLCKPEFDDIVREIDDYFNENTFLISASFDDDSFFSQLHKTIVEYESRTNKTIVLIKDRRGA